jgi:hypothetical protein
MDVASPWEPGLGQEQRRRAWLATLAALEVIQAEAGRLAESAAAKAVAYGADQAEIAEVAGAGRRGVRKRWPRLFGSRSGAGDQRGTTGESGVRPGTLSAHGRAASSRLDNLLPPV